MNEKGLTLIEVMVSIVILSIIVVSLLTFFVQSSRSNSFSENMIDSTYIAQTSIEEINNLNKTFVPPTTTTTNNLAEFKSFLVSKGYTSDASCLYCLGKVQNNRYVQFQLSSPSLPTTSSSSAEDLGKVVVEVYFDSTKTKKEAQMEMLFSWKN